MQHCPHEVVHEYAPNCLIDWERHELVPQFPDLKLPFCNRSSVRISCASFVGTWSNVGSDVVISPSEKEAQQKTCEKQIRETYAKKKHESGN